MDDDTLQRSEQRCWKQEDQDTQSAERLSPRQRGQTQDQDTQGAERLSPRRLRQTQKDTGWAWACVLSRTPFISYLSLIMSASHAVGQVFASRQGHTKDHHNNGTSCLPALHSCVRVGVWQCSLIV